MWHEFFLLLVCQVFVLLNSGSWIIIMLLSLWQLNCEWNGNPKMLNWIPCVRGMLKRMLLQHGFVVVVMFFFCLSTLYCNSAHSRYFLNLNQIIDNNRQQKNWVFLLCVIFGLNTARHTTLRSHTRCVVSCHRESIMLSVDKLILFYQKKKIYSSPFVSPIQHQTEQKK